jgi:hypothetical protein
LSALFPDAVADVAAGAAAAKKCRKHLARAKITQLEMLICKTFQKSKKPLEKIDALLAQFASDHEADGMTQISRALAAMIRLRKDEKKSDSSTKGGGRK